MLRKFLLAILFFFNDTATTEIYTLSLHDALPISLRPAPGDAGLAARRHLDGDPAGTHDALRAQRSEEHTSELQSQSNLVCRLLLEKKERNLMTAFDDKPMSATGFWLECCVNTNQR